MNTLNSSLFEIKYLEDILDSFCKATGMHTEAVNDKGKTFYIPANLERCEFCNFIRSQPNGEKMCQETYRQACLEATKWEEPYFFTCHAGLVIWAVPMVINGISFGSIICGQVLVWEPDQFFFEELRESNVDIADFEKLCEKASNLEVVRPERAQASANMLFIVVNHLLQKNIYILEKKEALKTQQLVIRRKLEERKKEDKQELVTEAEDYDNYFQKERRLLSHVRLGEKNKAVEVLQSILTDIYTGAIENRDFARIKVQELGTLVSRAAVDGGAKAERVTTVLNDFYGEITAIDNVEEYIFKGYVIVERLLDEVYMLAERKYLGIVKDAQKYIRENYFRNIKIDDVADHLFMSPSYLSRLFRKELDCTLNDYLTRVRIETAMEFLKRPELNVEQVAKSVGYTNRSHFAKIFKKHTGMNPLAYRNRLR